MLPPNENTLQFTLLIDRSIILLFSFPYFILPFSNIFYIGLYYIQNPLLIYLEDNLGVLKNPERYILLNKLVPNYNVIFFIYIFSFYFFSVFKHAYMQLALFS